MNDVTFKMVRIPAGEFLMGSPPDEPDRDKNETQHLVRITKPFWLGQTEVTQGLWKAVMGSNPSELADCGDDCPVEQVSWNDCQIFIRKLNGKVSGGNFRLPTEAEWEYACRTGSTTPFNTGRCLNADQANYEGFRPYSGCPSGVTRKRTVKVGSFAPNPWGLYEMHGNVLEWCQDWFWDYPSGPVTDPTGPLKGYERVYRGGGYGYSAAGCRSAVRVADIRLRFIMDNLGLRLARTEPERTTGEEQGPAGAKGRLVVMTQPEDAKIRILNIGFAYQRGMELDPGRYHVEVSANGYETTDEWVVVGGGEEKWVNVELRPIATASGEDGVRTFTVKGVSFKMIRIPAGEFLMGSPRDEPEREKNETQHRVRISRDFWLGQTEVTQGLWKAVMETNPSSFNNCGNDCPVEEVSWNDCQEFIRKLNNLFAGGGFRLPTEAEWEYACRAGTKTPFNKGRCLNSDQANYDGSYAYPGCREGPGQNGTNKVGSFAPNAWGLYDMHGNVCERCQDWFGKYPSGAVTDPTGPPGGSERASRGGGWPSGAGTCRSAIRFSDRPGTRDRVTGLRLARTG